MFRGKNVDFLSSAYRAGELRTPDGDDVDDHRAFEFLKASVQSRDWVVYTKAPFAGAANVLANRGRTHNLALCRGLLHQPLAEPREPETVQAMMLRLTGIDITVCCHCGVGTLHRMLVLAPQLVAAVPVSRVRRPP